MDTLSVLNQKELMIIFTYAPAGLGHLRVTDALYHGLPKNVTPVLLGAHDESIGQIHRITSIYAWGKSIMEIVQQGLIEDIFTRTYRNWLRGHTDLLYEQITTLLNQRIHIAKTLLVVATHFALAHQIAAIKEKLSADKQIQVILVVQVTDDSPQHMWYVPGADLTFVPSYKTREQLLNYARQEKLPPINIKVAPYPVNPDLAKYLTADKNSQRNLQVSLTHNHPIHVLFPVSGAATQLNFVNKLTVLLKQKSPRFQINIICRNVSYTQKFITEMLKLSFVKLITAFHRREIVSQYDAIYQETQILLEVTKPSEQAFKALLKPNQVGGSILLFSEPIGRQEYDNLAFLERHHLIPTASEHKYLWKMAKTNKEIKPELISHAREWRGLILPLHSKDAADFIWWCFGQQLFASMLKYRERENFDKREIDDNGVEIFWKEIADFLKTHK